MKKGLWALAGFLLFFFGSLAIVLSLVGVKLIFLQWTDAFGRLSGFVIKLIMMISGILIMYFNLTDWKEEEVR